MLLADSATPDLGWPGWRNLQGKRHSQRGGFGYRNELARFGDSGVVLGESHSCRNRRAARGPVAPSEQLVKHSDLACGKQANACRKLGLGGQAECTNGGLTCHPSAPAKGSSSADSSVEGAPGSESGDIGLSSVERALGSARNPPGHSGQVGRAARQGVPGIGSAASRKVEYTERAGTPRHVSGLGPGGGRQSSVPAGASGAKRGATRGRRALVVIRRLREWRLFPRRQSSR